MKMIIFQRVWLGVGGAFIVALLAGCGASPEAPTPVQRQVAAQTQIDSIQNNPNMPPEAKQRAIEGMKAQQKRIGVETVSIPGMASGISASEADSAVAKTQIQSIENNPNMPPEAKQRAIEGIRFQQKRAAH